MSDDKDKKLDVLVANFEHFYSMAMDHHTKAGTTSHILLVIVGAILVMVGYDSKICLDPIDVGSAILVICIGILGALWASKQMERYRYWEYIALEYQKEIKITLPDFMTKEEYKTGAINRSKGTYPGFLGDFFYWVQDRYLWILLHATVIALGFSLILAAFCWPSKQCS